MQNPARTIGLPAAASIAAFLVAFGVMLYCAVSANASTTLVSQTAASGNIARKYDYQGFTAGNGWVVGSAEIHIQSITSHYLYICAGMATTSNAQTFGDNCKTNFVAKGALTTTGYNQYPTVTFQTPAALNNGGTYSLMVATTGGVPIYVGNSQNDYAGGNPLFCTGDGFECFTTAADWYFKLYAADMWCGDSSCNNGENCGTCAADCGCAAGTSCVVNACVENAVNTDNVQIYGAEDLTVGAYNQPMLAVAYTDKLLSQGVNLVNVDFSVTATYPDSGTHYDFTATATNALPDGSNPNATYIGLWRMPAMPVGQYELCAVSSCSTCGNTSQGLQACRTLTITDNPTYDIPLPDPASMEMALGTVAMPSNALDGIGRNGGTALVCAPEYELVHHELGSGWLEILVDFYLNFWPLIWDGLKQIFSMPCVDPAVLVAARDLAAHGLAKPVLQLMDASAATYINARAAEDADLIVDLGIYGGQMKIWDHDGVLAVINTGGFWDRWGRSLLVTVYTLGLIGLIVGFVRLVAGDGSLHEHEAEKRGVRMEELLREMNDRAHDGDQEAALNASLLGELDEEDLDYLDELEDTPARRAYERAGLL